MNLFPANLYGHNPDNTVLKMNANLLDMLTQAQYADNQSFVLKQHMNDLYANARFSVQDTFEKYLKANPITLRPGRSFLRFVEATPYADCMQYRAEVPEGMTKTYLEYLEVCIAGQTRANNIIKDVIDPFSKFVSKMISDEIFRHQVGHHIKEFDSLNKTYEKTVSSYAECFGKNDQRASSAFGEVVKRNGDWPTVFSDTAHLKDLYQTFPTQDMTKKLNRLYEMMDELLDQIRLDRYEGVEKTVTELLGEGTYQIAKEVELAALTTWRSRVFINCINTTIENIEELVAHSKKD